MENLMNKKLFTLLAVLTIFAAACSSATDPKDSEASQSDSLGELLPFSQVQANDIVFEADPTDPNRGIFRVKTTEPMICAIVWGETEELGNFNNSLAMNGTGIIDHDVVLPGAQAGKTYYYRVQGTTANGNQYRSELATFTFEADESAQSAVIDSPARGTNLALDATVTEASSSFGNGWEAENAIDDDTNTEWSTSGDGDDGFIIVDLGSAKKVSGVEFLTRSMLNGTAITETYTVTTDNGTTFGPYPAGNPANFKFQEVDFESQKVRFDVETSTGGNVGAIEIRVFESTTK